MNPLEFRRATTLEIPLIMSLARRIWMDHYPAIIAMEQIEYMLDKFYSPQAMAAQLSDRQRFVLVFLEKEPVGFYAFSEKEKQAYFLHKFYLDTRLHQRGIGKEMLAHALSSMPGVQTLRLTVNRQNYKAINFYFRNGFVIESVEDFDIGQGFFMNDFVMVRTFISH